MLPRSFARGGAFSSGIPFFAPALAGREFRGRSRMFIVRLKFPLNCWIGAISPTRTNKGEAKN